jgi:toxin ParE1/3/4
VKLRYTRRAARQLDAVLGYVAAGSPQGADQVMDRLAAVIKLVREHPRSGTSTGKRDIRRIVANPYPFLIFYRATADEIIVHGIRHAARRPRG